MTANVRDFLPIINGRQSRSMPYAGCIWVPNSVKNHHYGKIISGVSDLLELGDQDDWWKLTMWFP